LLRRLRRGQSARQQVLRRVRRALVAAAAPSVTPAPPRHLAERILQSRQSLEGERKQVTVLFADMKGRWSCSPTATPRRRESSSTPCLSE